MQIQDIARDTSLDTLESNIQDLVNESKNLKNTLIGKDGVIDALESEFAAVSNIAAGYATVRAEIDSLITKYEEMGRAAAEAIF
jgi:hypothetical protein